MEKLEGNSKKTRCIELILWVRNAPVVFCVKHFQASRKCYRVKRVRENPSFSAHAHQNVSPCCSFPHYRTSQNHFFLKHPGLKLSASVHFFPHSEVCVRDSLDFGLATRRECFTKLIFFLEVGNPRTLFLREGRTSRSLVVWIKCQRSSISR